MLASALESEIERIPTLRFVAADSIVCRALWDIASVEKLVVVAAAAVRAKASEYGERSARASLAVGKLVLRSALVSRGLARDALATIDATVGSVGICS